MHLAGVEPARWIPLDHHRARSAANFAGLHSLTQSRGWLVLGWGSLLLRRLLPVRGVPPSLLSPLRASAPSLRLTVRPPQRRTRPFWATSSVSFRHRCRAWGRRTGWGAALLVRALPTWKCCAARGHTLDIRKASGPGPNLKEFGESQYDNIVLFATTGGAFFSRCWRWDDPSVALADKFSAGLSVTDMTSFFDEGGNVIYVVGPSSGKQARDLAAELGVELHSKGSAVLDHSTTVDGADASTVATSSWIASDPMVGGVSGSVAFRGTGMRVPAEDVLSAAVLVAGATAYSADPEQRIKGAPQSAGEQTVLVAAVQGENNARCVVIGSAFALSDEGASSTVGGKKAANAAFFSTLSQWVLQERGVLRAVGVSHRREDGRAPDHMHEQKEQPDLPRSFFPEPEVAKTERAYRIKDHVVYNVTLQQRDAEGRWHSFPAKDAQLEFVMLDPYVRTNLTHVGGGVHTASFQAPDTWGVFKFRLQYRRIGWTTLSVEDRVSLRPFNHNEYERYIPAAYPHYTATFALMVSIVALAYFFLAVGSKRSKQD
jgi:oligosaccharyltransferase complex subunit beta